VKVTADYFTLPREGEEHNGDAVVVRHEAEVSLVAVIDALGHGPRAAQAAQLATAYLDEAPIARGLRAIMEDLHARLRNTRGAAAMILLVGGGRLEGCGVGNVDVRGYNTRVPAVLTPGVLGAQLGKLKVFEAQLAQRGRIVMFSDGVSGRMSLDEVGGMVPHEACRVLMDRYRRPADDATVLVTDFEAS
jgi:negative regulator of sigma-B (phosphoserine phosphatase)